MFNELTATPTVYALKPGDDVESFIALLKELHVSKVGLSMEQKQQLLNMAGGHYKETLELLKQKRMEGMDIVFDDGEYLVERENNALFVSKNPSSASARSEVSEYGVLVAYKFDLGDDYEGVITVLREMDKVSLNLAVSDYKAALKLVKEEVEIRDEL